MSWTGVRFANPKSDVGQLVDMIRPLAEDFDDASFDLDQMRDSLAERGLISSSGATGQRAVIQSVARAGAHSTVRDLTRDPLYNQCKMMSEIYRALGWFRSLPNERLRFRLTNLGRTLSHDGMIHGAAFIQGVLRESLLGVVFPNPTSENIGVVNNRPFAWILRLAHALDGQICRDEMILGALSVTDDLAPGHFDKTVERIQKLRKGNYAGLHSAVEALATRHDVQLNTLKNYTRIPNGVMSSTAVGWGERTTTTGLYNRKGLPVYVLTDDAINTAEKLAFRFDVRNSFLDSMSFDDSVLFADHGYYSLLLRSGIPLKAIESDMENLAPRVNPVLEKLGISPGTPLLFNPELQVSDSVLLAATE